MSANQITLLAIAAIFVILGVSLIIRRLKRPPPPPQQHRPHSVAHGYDPADMARSKAAGDAGNSANNH